MARRSREVLFLLPILHEIGRRVRKNVCLATTFVHFHLAIWGVKASVYFPPSTPQSERKSGKCEILYIFSEKNCEILKKCLYLRLKLFLVTNNHDYILIIYQKRYGTQ